MSTRVIPMLLPNMAASKRTCWISISTASICAIGIAGCEILSGNNPDGNPGGQPAARNLCGVPYVGDDPEYNPVPIDFSDFEEFLIERAKILDPNLDKGCIGGLAYGRDDGDTLRVQVQRDSSGAFQLYYSEFTTIPGGPDCDDEFCFVENVVAERELTASEVAALQTCFENVGTWPSSETDAGCEFDDDACCTTWKWDTSVFGDDYSPGSTVDEMPIFLTLQSLRYGLLDPASQEGFSLDSLRGDWHDADDPDASNLSISNSSFDWELCGSDASAELSGDVAVESGQILLLPEARDPEFYYSPFCDYSGCGFPEEVVVHRVDENTIATTSGNNIVIWDRGLAPIDCSEGSGG